MSCNKFCFCWQGSIPLNRNALLCFCLILFSCMFENSQCYKLLFLNFTLWTSSKFCGRLYQQGKVQEEKTISGMIFSIKNCYVSELRFYSFRLDYSLSLHSLLWGRKKLKKVTTTLTYKGLITLWLLRDLKSWD